MLAGEVAMAATYAQRRALGEYGERLAAAELERRGLEVLERNWRCAQGELDIVARHRDLLVVCEVKTRSSDRYGSPVQAITPAKAERLHRLAFAWCAAHEVSFAALRVDVITVLLVRRSSPVVTHYAGLT
ncbi:MAG: YraN family protein [Nocardioidaceae bacterium]